jgi:hypothetical protein
MNTKCWEWCVSYENVPFSTLDLISSTFQLPISSEPILFSMPPFSRARSQAPFSDGYALFTKPIFFALVNGTDFQASIPLCAAHFLKLGGGALSRSRHQFSMHLFSLDANIDGPLPGMVEGGGWRGGRQWWRRWRPPGMCASCAAARAGVWRCVCMCVWHCVCVCVWVVVLVWSFSLYISATHSHPGLDWDTWEGGRGSI